MSFGILKYVSCIKIETKRSNFYTGFGTSLILHVLVLYERNYDRETLKCSCPSLPQPQAA